MEEAKEYKGRNGVLVLTDQGVIIRRGFRGWFFGGGFIRGDKTIPYSSIRAVQMKKAGLLVGYLQLSIAGGPESKSGINDATKDENTVTFTASSNAVFAEAKELIENRMHQTARSGHHAGSSGLDDLERLAKLKANGYITQAEYEHKKKELLGL